MGKIKIGNKTVTTYPPPVPEPGDYGYYQYMAESEMHDDFIEEDGYCPLHAENNDCPYGCGILLAEGEED